MGKGKEMCTAVREWSTKRKCGREQRRVGDVGYIRATWGVASSAPTGIILAKQS